jgi:Zinc-binding dehydrogenase
VVRRRAAVEAILELGGTEVICTEDEDLRERASEIAGDKGVHKAIDCVAGRLGADVSRALAPGGEMIVYGALSTRRRTDAYQLTLPLYARSLIYGTKIIRGFWLYRWFSTTPRADPRSPGPTFILVIDDAIRIRTPAGAPGAVRRRQPPGRSTGARRQAAAHAPRRLTMHAGQPATRRRCAEAASASASPRI